MLYLVQIKQTRQFARARHIDPAYGIAFDRAISAGVEAITCLAHVTIAAITVCGTTPITP